VKLKDHDIIPTHNLLQNFHPERAYRRYLKRGDKLSRIEQLIDRELHNTLNIQQLHREGKRGQTSTQS
jgi:hypothetical protein